VKGDRRAEHRRSWRSRRSRRWRRFLRRGVAFRVLARADIDAENYFQVLSLERCDALGPVKGDFSAANLSFVICHKATSLRRARFSVAYENMDADFSCSGLG
jgi:hypothetical protein